MSNTGTVAISTIPLAGLRRHVFVVEPERPGCSSRTHPECHLHPIVSAASGSSEVEATKNLLPGQSQSKQRNTKWNSTANPFSQELMANPEIGNRLLHGGRFRSRLDRTDKDHDQRNLSIGARKCMRRRRAALASLGFARTATIRPLDVGAGTAGRGPAKTRRRPARRIALGSSAAEAVDFPAPRSAGTMRALPAPNGAAVTGSMQSTWAPRLPLESGFRAL